MKRDRIDDFGPGVLVPDPASRVEASDEQAAQAQGILAYHERTKHHPARYAPGPGGLDWANQPDPFRTFAGAPALDPPLLADGLATPFAELYQPAAARRRRPALETIAVLFELALGLSAWKEYRGQRWALRCNPSSGNLHPTEGYAVLPALPGLPAGVYHYDSLHHRLERRCTLGEEAAAGLAGQLPPNAFLVGLSSVPWREAWKYGERAYRYCQHDLGHALAAVRYAAGALGWSALLLDRPADAEVAQWLGLDRAPDFAAVDPLDREHPGALVLVGPGPLPGSAPDAAVLAGGAWAGTANPLSREHVPWERIDRAAAATGKSRTAPGAGFQPAPLPPLRIPTPESARPLPAAGLLRRRRSALAFDGRTAADAGTLYQMLDRLLPRPGVAPWDLLPWRPHLHLALYLHRVRGLAPGLYLFERDRAAHERLRSACLPAFRWGRPAGCPEHLPLYLLAEGDLRERAGAISCHQDIAADGAFSLGMVAEFGTVIRAGGPWWYRWLFWEAGVVGQVLYLEAEATGLRGTGIGCYFDDAAHELLGLAGEHWQVLYQFAVGAPVEDARLRTLAPYAHLAGR
jgi:SagB-type dehydrogenase family enzyme